MTQSIANRLTASSSPLNAGTARRWWVGLVQQPSSATQMPGPTGGPITTGAPPVWTRPTSPLKLNCVPGGGRLEATMWCSRSCGRAELTLTSSHTTDVCEDAIDVAASDPASSDRAATGFRSGGSLVLGAGGPATGPMFAARLGPERRARTLRVRASRTSNPSTPMGTGVLLVSSLVDDVEATVGGLHRRRARQHGRRDRSEVEPVGGAGRAVCLDRGQGRPDAEDHQQRRDPSHPHLGFLHESTLLEPRPPRHRSAADVGTSRKNSPAAES